jgi:hypothetical protein
MRQNHKTVLVTVQREFDDYFKGERHQHRPEPELTKRSSE